MVSELTACFEREFGLDRLALRLWHQGAEQYTAHYTQRTDIISQVRNLSAPYCGPYVNDEVLSWLPAVPVLQSFCQIPLRDAHGEAFGVLLIGSDDPDRFTFDMHTHYLAQIGELISLTLLRLLGQP